jgi:hypothetical protein
MASSPRFLAWRILDFIIGGLFIFAGLVKVVDFLPLNLQHTNLHDFMSETRTFVEQMQLANPRHFAVDIDNYKILPWGIALNLAFYLPWLEMLCGVALIVRRLYRGALLILTALVFVFIAVSILAKARGIDITCGCFGHVSKNWSFTTHLAVDFAILAALVTLFLRVQRSETA